MKDSKKSISLTSRPGFRSIVASLLCILGGILVGFIVLLILALLDPEINISDAFKGLAIVLGGPFSGGRNSVFQFGNMLFQATPLIFTGMSVAIAFRTGLFNIGAPGQYLMGAMTSLLVALSIPTDVVPSAIVWILALLAGTAAGAAWGAIPGAFKAFLGVNEVIVCIMTNWIAANLVSWVFAGSKFINYAETKVNFIVKTETNNVATPTFGLDKLFSVKELHSYADISIFIAIGVAILMSVVINKTVFGYELKACGFNRDASKYAGMNAKRNIVLSMVIAGALAGAGAALWCINGHQDFKWETYQSLPADGFNGIPAALLAMNNPVGVIFTSLFLKFINFGGSNLRANTSFNEYVAQLIIAMIVYFSGFSRYLIARMEEKKKAAAENVSAGGQDVASEAAEASAAADKAPAEEKKGGED